jgi:divalent metal cation (Fe/Co/Zn/Cd) transporter
MTNFIVKHFIKDHDEIDKISVRTSYGLVASIVGIFCNVLLFGIKFTIGAILRSVSVMADGFNNLSDAGS